MNRDDIVSMFTGIDDDTKNIIAGKLKTELGKAILNVNNKMKGLTIADLSPEPRLIMNVFRIVSIHNIKIVILGQDTYINKNEATGLAFSVPKDVKIPPSLKNIYKCLLNKNLIKAMPEHGDLTNWAKQGVLLLNCALTTRVGKSGEHMDYWKEYTDALLKEISALPQQIIFILLGDFAQSKSNLIDKRRHTIFEWGHPSPLNSANRTDSPKSFKNCNVFVRANDELVCRGLKPICWNPDYDPSVGIVEDVLNEIDAKLSDDVVQVKPRFVEDNIKNNIKNNDKDNTNVVPTERPIVNPNDKARPKTNDDPVPTTENILWVFTDGGSSGNGKANCKASWGYYITDGRKVVSDCGLVPSVDIPGQVYKASNNRGELTAIERALGYVATSNDFLYDSIMVVSDSEYSINSVNVWSNKWFTDPVKYNLHEKKNVDIIQTIRGHLESIRKTTVVNFKHVNSHMPEPANDDPNWFMWKCNDIVDKLCNKALGRDV